MNVKDGRFKALFEDHQYAIDPTNPQFVLFFSTSGSRIFADVFVSFLASKRQKP